MADKKTTLKTKDGDNVYPNVLEGNIPDTIARTSDIQATYATKSALSLMSQTKQDKLTAGDNITINDKCYLCYYRRKRSRQRCPLWRFNTSSLTKQG